MSNTSKKAEAAEAGAAVTAAPNTAPIKYTAARLRKDCFALYGVSTSTFDGANVGVSADKEFTVAEMAARIKKWQDTPVRPKSTKKEGK